MNAVETYLNTISPLSPDALVAVLALFKPAALPKGTLVAQAGRVETQIGILTEGVVRAFFRNAEGEEYNKTLFTPITFVGAYASLITGEPNQINLQTLTDVSLMTAPYAALTALYDTYPDAERLARRLAERYYVAKEQREIEIVMLDARQRYLLFQQRFPLLEQQIPQYHVASYLGITPTQLSRIRRGFADGA
jgi:CRP-like cAMP-binding protein